MLNWELHLATLQKPSRLLPKRKRDSISLFQLYEWQLHTISPKWDLYQHKTVLQLSPVSNYDDPTYQRLFSLGLDINWPITDVFVIYKSIAFEFALYYCIQQWNTTTVNGQFSSSLTEQWSNSSTFITEQNAATGPSTILTVPNDNTVYNVSSTAMVALTSFLKTVLVGTYKPNGSGEIYSTEASRVLAALTNTGNDMPTAFGKIMNNIAISLTNNIQEKAEPNKLVRGQNTKDETYIKVVWPWLSLLSLLVLLSLSFLIFTILNSSRHKSQIWKSSSLAVLQGLDGEAREDLGGLDRISDLEYRAEKITVMLEEEQQESGWKLVKTLGKV